MKLSPKACQSSVLHNHLTLTHYLGIPVFGLAGTIQEETAKELGLPFVAELYGDVKYSKDGKLVIDRKKKAWTSDDTRKHITSQVENSSVTAVTGEDVELPIGVSSSYDECYSSLDRNADEYQDYDVSLCCHSDSPGAVEIVTMAREIVDGFNKKMGYA